MAKSSFMASFQVPQFLDSGDKIIFNLNLRQFGYALGGFLISMAIYAITSAVNPALGLYAFLPAVPVALISAYAALGSYNGRDADFYIVKFIIFVIKPKLMVFNRQPDNSDLNAKLSEYTEAKIKERWAARINQNKIKEGDQFSTFDNQDAEEKAEKIRLLGNLIDTNINNANARISGIELKKVSDEQRLEQLNLAKPPILPFLNKEQAVIPTPPPVSSPPVSSSTGKSVEVNFFDEDLDKAA